MAHNRIIKSDLLKGDRAVREFLAGAHRRSGCAREVLRHKRWACSDTYQNDEFLKFIWGIARNRIIKSDLLKGDEAVPEFLAGVHRKSGSPREVLRHKTVGVFLNKFGRNSTLQSLCGSVDVAVELFSRMP